MRQQCNLTDYLTWLESFSNRRTRKFIHKTKKKCIEIENVKLNEEWTTHLMSTSWCLWYTFWWKKNKKKIYCYLKIANSKMLNNLHHFTIMKSRRCDSKLFNTNTNKRKNVQMPPLSSERIKMQQKEKKNQTEK